MSSDPFLVDERANDLDASYIIQVLFNGLHSDRKPFAFQLCMDADRGLQSGCDAADRLTVKAKDVLFIQNVKFCFDLHHGAKEGFTEVLTSLFFMTA